MRPVKATKAFFIKLGERGKWEAECFRDGTLRLGYLDQPHDLCAKSDWISVRASFPKGSDSGSITRHIYQIRKFYEELKTTLWITFYGDKLWWCFAEQEVIQLHDKSKIRKVIGKWRSENINGIPLSKSCISGKLLAVQSFQGTICDVKSLEYLLHKINGTSEPHVSAAASAFEDLKDKLIPIIKDLHPKDLETLTDLIFRNAGWQRTSVLGGVEKDLDLQLLSPITKERIGVQVKSKASLSVYCACLFDFSEMKGFDRFYFVTHSPDASMKSYEKKPDDVNCVFWDAVELAQQAARGGLIDWLLEKSS